MMKLTTLKAKDLSNKHVQVLEKFAALRGEILQGRTEIKGSGSNGLQPDMFVDEPHLLHGLVRGIYVPKGDRFALSIQLTEKEANYGNEIRYSSPEVWRIEYRPPTDKSVSGRAKSDTRALENCYRERIPVGILRNMGKSRNEVLGLGIIDEMEGSNFVIIPFLTEDSSNTEVATSYVHHKIKAGNYAAPDNPTVALARQGQQVFRKYLIEVYGGRCAFCGFDVERYLIASHIVPWSKDRDNRLNPRNGLLLCRMCDCAFETGDIRVTKDLQILKADHFKGNGNNAVNSWMKSIGSIIHVQRSEYAPAHEFIHAREMLLASQRVDTGKA